MTGTPRLHRAEAGHAMAQLAACRCTVGVASVDRLTLLELRGSGADLAAAHRLLCGHAHRPGQTERLACGWWCAASPHRALVLEDPATPGQLRRRLDSLVGCHPDVALVDVSDMHLGLILAGPRARSAAARWEAHTMAVSDGDQYTVLVLRRDPAVDAREVALDVGRADGAVLIHAQTAELHRAAGRVRATVISVPARQTFTDTTTTGGPHS